MKAHGSLDREITVDGGVAGRAPDQTRNQGERKKQRRTQDQAKRQAKSPAEPASSPHGAMKVTPGIRAMRATSSS